MHGIRDRLLQDLAQMELIIHKRPSRFYSQDDYLLVEGVQMQKPKNYDLYRSDSGQIFGNDPFTFSPATIYMAESRYEQVRRDLR